VYANRQSFRSDPDVCCSLFSHIYMLIVLTMLSFLPMNSISPVKANSVHELLLLLQRRMRWVRLNLPFPLPAHEAIVVSVLAREEKIIASEIADGLGLQRSKVSRIVNRLAGEKYLELIPDEQDRRVRQLSFTPHGQALLHQLSEVNNAIATLGLSPLTKDQQYFIAQIFNSLADGLKAPPLRKLPDEHPLVPEQRRIVRQTGMVGKEYMQTGFELMSYQILFELFRHSAPRRFRDIAAVLPFEAAKLSREIDHLTDSKLVKKSSLASDRRAAPASLTEKGKKIFSEHHEQIAGTYQLALVNVEEAELDLFIERLNLVTKSPLPGSRASEITTKICTTEEERKATRTFLVETLVRENRHGALGEKLVATSNFVVLLYQRDELVGVAEFRKERRRWFLEHFCTHSSFASPDKGSLLLRRAIQELLHVKEGYEFFAADQTIADPAIFRLFGAVSEGNLWKFNVNSVLN